jgi:hypothetical protein
MRSTWFVKLREVTTVRRARTGWLVAAAAAALLAWQAQVAHAATTTEVDAEGARHCVVGMAPIPAGGTMDDATASEPTCYDSFAEAIEAATGGRLLLDADANSVAQQDLQEAGAVSTPKAQVARPLLGVEYQNSSYGGNSLVLYGSSGSGCYAGEWYGFPSMASLGFDNRISSAKMYSNCVGKHHAGSSYTGDYTYCSGNCSSLGSLNDRTSSIKFI